MGIAGHITASQRSLNALVHKFYADEDGATAIEYGLIVSLIFIAIIAAVKNFTTETTEMYNTITNAM